MTAPTWRNSPAPPEFTSGRTTCPRRRRGRCSAPRSSAARGRAGDVLPVDYLAFGPIFATATKADSEPAVGLAGLREARRLTRKPLMAIGGITPANAAAVIEAGADGVAVIAGWLGADDIPARLEEFRRTLGRLD